MVDEPAAMGGPPIMERLLQCIEDEAGAVQKAFFADFLKGWNAE
jgi:hypothetical protein